MESYGFESIDDAINRLQKLKENGEKSMVIVFTIDFDNGGDSTKSIISPDEGCVLVKHSSTIIMNEDTYVPHMQLFSTPQPDLRNIIRKGKMHDVIFPR